jgi:hypothetical protein
MSKQTGTPKEDIKVDREAAKEYFDDGIPPYFCFREEMN